MLRTSSDFILETSKTSYKTPRDIISFPPHIWFSFFPFLCDVKNREEYIMGQERQEAAVIIVGAGPAGLATAACLTVNSVPYIILEREDFYAPLWTRKAYDRLHLHLAKQFCELPHMSFPTNWPKYVPNKQFMQYLEDYVSHFNINPLYRRSVELASYNEVTQKWNVKARNIAAASSNEIEEYSGRFLVVATGETSDPFIPVVEGMKSFSGEVLHSTQYKSGKEYKNKSVLVVGSGNSGMEIAFDLSNYGAKSSILVRSPIHIISREMMYFASILFKYLSFNFLESLLVILSKLKYGDLTKYGIRRPQEGPFTMKVKYNKYPIIDVGTCKKIKSGEIQVFPAAITSIRGNDVLFVDGKSHPFDAIVFATGFRRSTNQWLKGYECLLNDDGFSKNLPNNWKGENGLYCAGLSKRGFFGLRMDAQNIANDIKLLL